MADNRDLIEALRNPRIQAEYERFRSDPYAFAPPPNRPAGPEFRNLPPRPNDALQAALAEQISPTMGAYGAGSLAAQIGVDAKEGNWSGIADAAPLALGMAVGGKPKGRTLYHGTPRAWEGEFDIRKSGLREPAGGYIDGMHLAPTERGAGGYSYGPNGSVYAFEDMTKKPFKWDRGNQYETTKRIREIFPEYNGKDIVEAEQIKAWTEALKRHGYDSVEVYDNGKLTEIGVVDPKRDLRRQP